MIDHSKPAPDFPDIHAALFEAAREFLRHGRDSGTYTDATITAYRGDLLGARGFCPFLADHCGITDPRDVVSAHIQDFLASLRDLANGTKGRRLRSISTWFKQYLVPRELVDEDPTQGLKAPPNHPKEAVWVRPHDLQALRAATRGVLERALWEALGGLALRRSEVIGLQLTDFDRERRTVHVEGKGRQHRTLTANATVVAAFEAYLQERPPADSQTLFITSRGVPMTPKVLRTMFRRWCRRAGLVDRKYTPHAVRHGVATLMDRRGVPIGTIRDFLGHENIATTNTYIHSDDEQMRQAADLLGEPPFSDGPSPSERVAADRVPEVPHCQAEVTGSRVEPRVPEEALQRVKVAPALEEERGAGVPEAVQHHARPVYPGTFQSPSQKPN